MSFGKKEKSAFEYALATISVIGAVALFIAGCLGFTSSPAGNYVEVQVARYFWLAMFGMYGILCTFVPETFLGMYFHLTVDKHHIYFARAIGSQIISLAGYTYFSTVDVFYTVTGIFGAFSLFIGTTMALFWAEPKITATGYTPAPFMVLIGGSLHLAAWF